MVRLKKYITNILKGLLLILFIGYYCSITMFYHSHLVNGHVLNHSHPYKHDKNNKSPFEPHQHSSSAYNYIHQLNEASWKDTAVSAKIPNPAIYYFESICAYNTPFLKTACYSFCQLRAPPVAC
jgi:hypothetical protein